MTQHIAIVDTNTHQISICECKSGSAFLRAFGSKAKKRTGRGQLAADAAVSYPKAIAADAPDYLLTGCS